MTETALTPLALFFLLLMGILLLALPRKYAILPFLLSTLYMTMGQQIVMMDLHFTLIRVLIVIGVIRIIIRKDANPIQLNTLDKIIMAWGVVVIITGLLQDIGTNQFNNLQHRSGQILGAFGIYYFFRFYITGIDDIKRVTGMLAFIIAPLAIAFLLEKVSGRNIFSVFGGIPEFTMIRGDRLRCQGPFRHPILAGTLGATLMPVFISLWLEKGKQKVIAFIGIVSSMIIMITSASSGPLLVWISAVIALFMWPLRDRMRMLRWTILIALITLHFIMKAPIWYLIGRISTIIGGTGFHRSDLIDTAIKHFNEWWLIGTTNTAHWLDYGVEVDTNMIDVTNQYILEGIYGGSIRMILFIAIIAISFKGIGLGVKYFKDDNFATRFLPWTLGAALFAHVVGFISVAYFDQLTVIWYMLLAMISTISKTSIDVPEKAAAAVA